MTSKHIYYLSLISISGFTISIIAYSDIIWNIMDVIVSCFNHPENNYESFEETNDEFFYYQYQNLHQLARSYFRRMIKYNRPEEDWNPTGIVNLMKTFDSISNNSIISILFYGHIHKLPIRDKFNEYAKQFNYSQPFTLNYFTLDTPSQALSIIHTHEEYLGSYIVHFYNSDLFETDQLVNNYFQIGIKNDNLIAEASILLSILRDVARGFLLLGNKRAIEIFIVDNIVYYDFNVEHSEMSPDLLDKHLDIIVDVLYSKLNGMKDAEFDAYKNKVMFDLRLTYYSLSHKANLVWNEIYRNTLEFNRKTISSFIMNYNKGNAIEFLQKVFFNKNSVRKISIQLYKPGTDSPYRDIEKIAYRLNGEITSIVTTYLNVLAYMHEPIE